MAHILSCSFCRKSEHQVEKLLAGVGVYICDECVNAAARIIQSENSERKSAPSFRSRLVAWLSRRPALRALRSRMMVRTA